MSFFLAYNAFYSFFLSSNDRSALRHLQQTTLDQDDDDFLPEDVDASEAGWATDYAVTVLGLCFFITALSKYPQAHQHFSYMHFGTAWAHFFGGFAHALFPNRASDGTGMLGFYISMILGYIGNCMRWGLGWGLGKYWTAAATANAIYLVAAGGFAIAHMEHTTERVDDAHSSESAVPADTVFGYGELICAVGELVASTVYAWRNKTNWYVWVAVVSNWIGWVSVYALGLWSTTTDGTYNTQATQLIFHYAMMVMLWALNEVALEDGVGGRNNKSQPEDDISEA